ncbi:vegetative cell wall protein gp1-like [Triticum dicoccoides]|uniref:vegetative cell wall protein gp1-like n=1 Tax=Triticum dicoccoides TaxID=85692 RepID=UPI00188FC91B|nr:vegetative cell wall protein gp1-like [Triticum dicoccoides]
MTHTRAPSPTLPAPSRRHPTGLASSPLSPPASSPHLLRSTSPRTRPSPSAPCSPARARAYTGSASSSPRRAGSPPPAPRGLRYSRPCPCACPCSGCAPTSRPQCPPLGRRLPPSGSASAHAPASSAYALCNIDLPEFSFAGGGAVGDDLDEREFSNRGGVNQRRQQRGWRELQEPRRPSPWLSRYSRATIAVIIGALKRFMGQATHMGVSAKHATGWVTK